MIKKLLDKTQIQSLTIFCRLMVTHVVMCVQPFDSNKITNEKKADGTISFPYNGRRRQVVGSKT
jgi:hypothetical protein